ncbi:MAG: hypothetical protein JXD21_03810 [Candidatus Omnitrophica bacterium]|nr:hypothetical protein [Candidatus Omnitrophota bacterium]
MTKNMWNLSLAISIMLHGALLFSLPAFFARQSSKKVTRELQIVPQELEKIPLIEGKEMYLEKPPAYIDNIVKKTILDSTAPFSLEKPDIDMPGNPIQLVIEKVESIFPDEQSKETLFSQDQSPQETPAYMDYYRAVREKIRNVAHRYYNNSEKGVVTVSFIIRKDGNLSALDLSQDESANYQLIQVARRSVNDAAPFPSFPQELDYSQLQFNLSIHFKSN